MIFQQTTQVPNVLFDQYLPKLTESELKLLLVVIRQTYGWIDKRTGGRKTRDRISHGQFIQKTGLSRRVISKALKSLADIGLIKITCHSGSLLHNTEDRRGKTSIFYSLNMCTQQQRLVHLTTQTCAESAYNKTNYTKINKTKESNPNPKRAYQVMHISDVLKSSGYKLKCNGS